MNNLTKNSLILSGPYGYKAPAETAGRKRDEIVTFFYQGHGASRAQAASYAGEDGVDVLFDNQLLYHAVCPGASRLLHNVHGYNELAEVCYEKARSPLQIAYKLVSSFRNVFVNAQGALAYFLDLSQISLAGDIDIAQFVTYYEQMVKITPSRHHVVFGCSRGASTAITGVATLTEKLQKSISLVIAEAPFDSVASVLRESSMFHEIQQEGLRVLTSYRDDQKTPLQAIEEFPMSVPIAFITSDIDTRVPSRCTETLMERLRARGHKMVHHLVLKRSQHSVMSLQDPEDVKSYLKFLEELYDLYCPQSSVL